MPWKSRIGKEPPATFYAQAAAYAARAHDGIEVTREVMQTLNFRGTSPELTKKLEETRLNLPKLRGEKFDEWVTQWRKDNLTEKEEINIGSWVVSRFKAGKNAIALEWLKKMSDKQGKPFANAAEFTKWLDDEGFPADVKEKMIAIVPNTAHNAARSCTQAPGTHTPMPREGPRSGMTFQ